MKEVDPALRWFNKQMRAKLALPKNLSKTHWLDCGRGYLLRRLRSELRELTKAMRKNADTKEIVSEAADIANFAMMIADQARKDSP